jgi:hypothetical protein
VGDLRINEQGKVAAVTFRKMIFSVPVVQANTAHCAAGDFV